MQVASIVCACVCRMCLQGDIDHLCMHACLQGVIKHLLQGIAAMGAPRGAAACTQANGGLHNGPLQTMPMTGCPSSHEGEP